MFGIDAAVKCVLYQCFNECFCEFLFPTRDLNFSFLDIYLLIYLSIN